MPLPYQQFFIPAIRVDCPGIGVLANLDGNGLLFEWEITRTRTSEPDTGTVSIYNMSQTIAGALQTRANNTGLLSTYNVSVSIGWQGQTSLLMTADLWRVVPARRSPPTDVVTELHLGDGLSNLRDAQMGFNVAQLPFSKFLVFAITAPVNGDDAGGGGLGLLLTLADKTFLEAQAVKLTLLSLANAPVFNSSKQAVDFLMATMGLEWRVHNGFFIPLRGGIKQGPGFILRPNRGLIDYTRRDDGGVSLSALAIPELEPGMQLQVQDNIGKNLDAPVYRVDTVRFQGSSKGESVMMVEAERARLQ